MPAQQFAYDYSQIKGEKEVRVMETNDGRRRRRSASAERIKNAYNGANNVEVEVIEAVGTAKTDDTPK